MGEERRSRGYASGVGWVLGFSRGSMVNCPGSTDRVVVLLLPDFVGERFFPYAAGAGLVVWEWFDPPNVILVRRCFPLRGEFARALELAGVLERVRRKLQSTGWALKRVQMAVPPEVVGKFMLARNVAGLSPAELFTLLVEGQALILDDGSVLLIDLKRLVRRLAGGRGEKEEVRE